MSRTFFRVLPDALSEYSSPWSLQIPILDGLSVLDHILALIPLDLENTLHHSHIASNASLKQDHYQSRLGGNDYFPTSYMT